jgi:hypothetical protein
MKPLRVTITGFEDGLAVFAFPVTQGVGKRTMQIAARIDEKISAAVYALDVGTEIDVVLEDDLEAEVEIIVRSFNPIEAEARA